MKKKLLLLLAMCACASLSANDNNSISEEDLFDEISLEEDFSSSDSFVATKKENSVIDTRFELPKDKHYFSLASIYEKRGQMSYGTLFPQFYWHSQNFSIHAGLPLRFSIYDSFEQHGEDFERKRGFVSFYKFIRPKKNDFMSLFDVQRVLQNMRLASTDLDYVLELSRTKTLNLSKGILVKDLVPNWLYDQDYLFASGHANWEAVQLQSFVGPFFKMQMFGANVTTRPFFVLDAPSFIKDMNLDITYAADYNAPNYTKKFRINDEKEAFELDHEQRMIKRSKGVSQGLALTFLSSYVPIHWFGLRPYSSFSQLLLSGIHSKSVSYGAGWHLGNDIDFYLSSNPKSVITLSTEGRLFSPSYSPSYFDSTYMLDRYSLNQLASFGPNKNNTKSLFLSNPLNKNVRLGYLFGLNYSYNDIAYSSIEYENAHSGNSNFIPEMRKLKFFVGAKILDRAALSFRYEAYNIKQFNKLFDFDKNRELLSSKCQVKILPFLYADVFAQHKFGVKDVYSYSEDGDYLKNLHWLSGSGETRSFDFGMGLEFAMQF